MSGRADDLSGGWRGTFHYPHGLPPTYFSVILSDRDGLLSGTVEEPLPLELGRSGTIGATLDGRRQGSSVRFTKFYDPDRDFDAVAYEGTISPEGDEVSGRWNIAGAWSGTVLMVREPGQAAEATRRTEVPAELTPARP